MLRFALEQLELGHVFARPLQRNARPRRVLQRLNFEQGPVETHEHPKWSEDDPVVRNELTRHDWRSGAE
jgi:RimJ/RimL family protein N-acetyltransferase